MKNVNQKVDQKIREIVKDIQELDCMFRIVLGIALDDKKHALAIEQSQQAKEATL